LKILRKGCKDSLEFSGRPLLLRNINLQLKKFQKSPKNGLAFTKKNNLKKGENTPPEVKKNVIIIVKPKMIISLFWI